MNLLERAQQEALTPEQLAQALKSPGPPAKKESYRTGEFVPGKGIFLGVWEPIGSDAKPLGEYNVFAAPEDLKDAEGQRKRLNFAEAAAEVAALRNWHGHNGADLTDHVALISALKSGHYRGEWFIPPLELICGKKSIGNTRSVVCSAPNLAENKDTGSFKGTFDLGQPFNQLGSYWSSSRDMPCTEDYFAVFMETGSCRTYNRTMEHLLCRPCRLEAVPQ
jgi:hypothetical protein